MSRQEPFDELARHELDPSVSGLLPLDYCLEHQVAILGRFSKTSSDPVTVGALRPGDRELVSELSRMLGRRVVAVQLNGFEVRRAISRIYGIPLDVEDERRVVRVNAGRALDFSPTRTPVELLEDLLSVAIARRATDVHIEVYANDVDLRFRIDGVLEQETTPLSPDNVGRVVSRIKVLCDLDHAERRRSQDGRFSVLLQDDDRTRRIDVRVTVLPGSHGEDVAMRLLDPDRGGMELEQLGMPPGLLTRYRNLARYPHGLLLTTGPTGSGKTTTLYASLPALRAENRKILTAEDPVELVFPKVNQKAVTPQMGFADWLRTFLRANPDAILIGEIRDAETAEVAVRAATTGHLVLSTLHTSDALGAVGRLRVLGVPDDYVAEVLIGVLAQRLVRRICAGCRREVTPRPDLVPRYFETPPDRPFFEGGGCGRCGGTGYDGLVGIFELLQPDAVVSDAISRGVPVNDLRRLAGERGWTPLLEDALRKAGEGLTTLEEIARRIPPKFPIRA